MYMLGALEGFYRILSGCLKPFISICTAELLGLTGVVAKMGSTKASLLCKNLAPRPHVLVCSY